MPSVLQLIKEPHLVNVDDVCDHHEVSVDTGLSHHVVIERQTQHGPNELPSAEVVPAWKKFFAQFNDSLILILTLLKTLLVPTKKFPVAGFVPQTIAGAPSILTLR